MKRSRLIDLHAMRATEQSESTSGGSTLFGRETTSLRASAGMVAIAVGASSLVACGGEPEPVEDVKIVSSVEDCVAQSKLSEQECEVAYKKAVENASRTGPRYRSRYECESEYGYGRCRGGSSGIFMPLMTGFMIGRMMGGRSYNPVYQYAGRNSRLNGRLMTANGSVLSRSSKGSYQVGSSSLKPQSRSTKTSSRGGFGSKSSAKSSWGRSRSSRSWGG